MRSTAANHSHVALLCACGLGVLFAVLTLLPNFLQRVASPYPFEGIEMMGPDQEQHYAARVREVVDGHWGLGNTFFAASKDAPYIQPPIPEIALALPAVIFRWDTVRVFLIWKGLFSILLVLLFFLFARSIVEHSWIALIATTMVLFAGAPLSTPWDLPHFFHPWSVEWEFLRFSRAVNPQWTVSWFLLALIGVERWMRGRRHWLWISMIAATVLVYSYVYAWMFFFGSMGVLTVHACAVRDRRRLSDLFLFWLVVATLSIPYALHLRETMQHPWYVESVFRLGLHDSRQPIIGVWAVVFIAVSMLSRRLWPRTWPLLPALAIGGILALNQHLFTGKFIVPHHVHWYFIQPLASLLGILLVLAYLRRCLCSSLLRIIGGVIVVILSVGVGSMQQVYATRDQEMLWGEIQRAAPALRFLEAHLRPGQVVYARSPLLADLVAVYTSADVYSSANDRNYLNPTDKLRDVYFFDLWLSGVTSKQAEREFFTTRRKELSSRLFAIGFRELRGTYEDIPDHLVALYAEQYEEYLRRDDAAKIALHPLDVILTSPEDPDTREWQSLLRRGREVVRRAGYGIVLLSPLSE